MGKAEFERFGSALRFYRKRARLTQDELARAVGYGREQIGHLESGRRMPDVTSVAALFAPALHIADDTQAVADFIKLAIKARSEKQPDQITRTTTTGTQTSVTETLTFSSRVSADAQQHRQAAQWAEMAEGNVIKAAHEYVLAGDIKEAADVLTDQGTVLAGQGKGDDAAAAVDAVLALLDAQPGGRAGQSEMVCRLLATRGDALVLSARAEEAERDYRAASELASGAVRASLNYRLGGCMVQRGRAAEAVLLARQTLDEIPTHLSLIRAQLLVVESVGLLGLARYAEAEQRALEVVALADALTPVVPMVAAGIRARGNNTLGTLHALHQDLRSAIGYWRAAIDTARVVGMRSLEYRAQGNIANASFELGELEASSDACALALEGLLSIGDQHGAARFMHLSALLAFMQGDMPNAIAHAKAACDAKQQIGDTSSLALSRAQLGKSLLGNGQLAEASQVLDTAIAEAQRAGNQHIGAHATVSLAEVEIAQGNAAGAEARCRALLALAEVRDDIKIDAAIRRTLAMALFAQHADALAREAMPALAIENAESALEHRLVALLLNNDARDVADRRLALDTLSEEARARRFLLLAQRVAQLRDALDGATRQAQVLAVLTAR
jgi:transcriptional regulator with XRE-family HTH domain